MYILNRDHETINENPKSQTIHPAPEAQSKDRATPLLERVAPNFLRGGSTQSF